jgi:hypothetical protein
MWISVQRSGGFTDIRPTDHISTDQMLPEDAKKLGELVDEAGFFGLPSEMRSTEPGNDPFQYKITVESQKGTHTVQVDEAAMPPNLKLLKDWIRDFKGKRGSK